MGDHGERAGLQQSLGVPGIAVQAAGEADDAHSSRPARSDTGFAILNDQTFIRFDAALQGSEQEDVGSWLSTRHLTR